MKITDNTILISGGATGIGFALAEAFIKAGNKVIVCGRRENRLQEAKNRIPQLHIKVCDVSNEKERKELTDWAFSNFRDLNILVNNAGIQRIINFRDGYSNRTSGEDEIDTNLKAPIHLSEIFIPHLLKIREAAIVNISSGLGFIPLAMMPVYCATKAGLHSFSLSLRHQLKDSSIKVFEIIPPTVDTELDKGEREKRSQANRGIPPSMVAQETLKALQKNIYECAVGMAENLRMAARKNPEEAFKNMNSF